VFDVRAAYVLGGWLRSASSLSELGRVIEDGLHASPITEVTVTSHGAVTTEERLREELEAAEARLTTLTQREGQLRAAVTQIAEEMEKEAVAWHHGLGDNGNSRILREWASQLLTVLGDESTEKESDVDTRLDSSNDPNVRNPQPAT
jgi:hypothetical protein